MISKLISNNGNSINYLFKRLKYQQHSFHKTRMMKIKNYYKILSITSNSTEYDVKKAFLLLAKKFHPDLNKSAEAKERFADILEAYDVLSDKTKKKIYDKSGLTASEQEDLEYTKSKENELSGTAGMFVNDIEEDEEGEVETKLKTKEDAEAFLADDTTSTCSKICTRTAEFYGESPIAKESQYIAKENTHDILTEITVSFMESVEGCIKAVSFNRCYLCEECKGEFCFKCYGKGYRLSQASEKVNIPKSNKASGFLVIKLNNKGNVYKVDEKVSSSHLYVRVKVDDHEYFKREGDNIVTNYYITLSQAVLGAELHIRTLHGIKQVKLRRYKDKVVLMNEGINKQGKHIVKINVKFPTMLNEEQEKIFRKIGEFENKDNDRIEVLKKINI